MWLPDSVRFVPYSLNETVERWRVSNMMWLYNVEVQSEEKLYFISPSIRDSPNM